MRIEEYIMEDFIKRIIEIDKKAQKLSVDKQAMQNKADEEIKIECQKIKNKIAEKTEKTIEEYSLNLEKETNKKLNKKRAYYNNISDNFDLSYNTNKTRWIYELVNRSLD